MLYSEYYYIFKKSFTFLVNKNRILEILYKNNKLEKQLTNDKEIIKAYGMIRAKKLKKRLGELQAATTLSDLKTIKSARLHQLIGDKKGLWAIDILKNWRICFEIFHDPIPLLEDGGVDIEEVTDIKIISIEDYH